MPREVRRFAVTIPANTPKSAGFTADLSFPARVVRKLSVRVPPGPRGEVGFAVGAAGVPIIPYNAGAYVVANDETIPWEADGYHDSGSWTCFAYNTGRYVHVLEFRFEVDLPGERAGPITLFPTAALGGGVSSIAELGAPVVAAGAGASTELGALPPITVPPIAVPELPPIVIPPLPAPVVTPITLPVASVASLYTDLLGRPADPVGAAYWLSQTLGNGGPLTWPQLVVRFAGADEAATDARLHPDAFVAGLYLVLLGRPADAAGLAYWADRIAGPVHPAGDLTGAQVAGYFAASDEAQAYAAALPVGP